MLTKATIGTFADKPVEEIMLESASGVRVAIMNWGVVVRDWQVPVGGFPRHVVLGFDSFDPYPRYAPFYGAVVGRVANRIRNARFTLNGKTCELPANDGPNHLHGGPDGLSFQVWEMEPDSVANAVRFSLFSPAGQMGYPGNVRFEALYSLDGNRLRLDLSGIPDEPTPINVVQHHYFNLGATETVLDHTVHLPSAVAKTVFTPDQIPNGIIEPVNGTLDDFLSPRSMRYSSGLGIDYNANYVLATGRDTKDPIAIATGEDGALALRLRSDQPGVQFYNGIWNEVPMPGHAGQRYGKNSGLCFEDQHFPDAVNYPHFPSIIATPDHPYRHWCEIEIA